MLRLQHRRLFPAGVAAAPSDRANLASADAVRTRQLKPSLHQKSALRFELSC